MLEWLEGRYDELSKLQRLKQNLLIEKGKDMIKTMLDEITVGYPTSKRIEKSQKIAVEIINNIEEINIIRGKFNSIEKTLKLKERKNK